MTKHLNLKPMIAMLRFIFAVMVIMLFAVSGRAQQQSSPSGPPEAPAGWRTYTDNAYGFTIRYPKTFIILREPKGQPDTIPRIVQRVRFQDKQLASGQTADLEPPQFSIEVLENDGSAPLRDWLRSAIQIGANDTVEPFHLDGTGEGLRLRYAAQLAPNDFYFLARGKYVFKLTPLGQHGEEMLNSFRFRLNRSSSR